MGTGLDTELEKELILERARMLFVYFRFHGVMRLWLDLIGFSDSLVISFIQIDSSHFPISLSLALFLYRHLRKQM